MTVKKTLEWKDWTYRGREYRVRIEESIRIGQYSRRPEDCYPDEVLGVDVEVYEFVEFGARRIESCAIVNAAKKAVKEGKL